MAVVINEFEVVESATPATHGQDAGAAHAQPPVPPQAEDVRQLLAQCAELQSRRYSH